VEIRYHKDRDTGLLHIEAHGVREQEVAEVLRRPLENLPGDRNSRIVIGRTASGRLLKVISVPDDDGDGVFVVTAYDLAGKPLKAHNRRMRRRGTR
jgi:hypothetical protein